MRPVHIQQVMKGVAGLSDSMQHKALLTMRQLFTTVRQNGLILADPTEGVKTTPHAKPQKKTHLTPAEQEAPMSSLSDPRARCFVGLCPYCGLRREEALGLQWGDIQGDKLTVNRSMAFVGTLVDTSQELKNKSSHRTVPIPQPLQAILSETPHLGLYVVTRASGEPMTQSGFRRMWDIVRREAPCEVRAHMLRHTFGSSLVTGIRQPDGTIKALSPRQVADPLDHSTSQITEMYYVKKDATRLQGITDGFNF